MTEQKKRFDSKGKQATQRKGKKFVAKKVATPSNIIPIYLYKSACCDANGKKAPLVRQARDSKTFGEGHLGVFRCSGCNRHSQFKKVLNKDQEAFAV